MSDWLFKSTITSESWNGILLAKAYEYAAAHSDDDSTQNGAVLLLADNSEILGCNHFVDGVKKLPARLSRPQKYNYFVHAERDVLFRAARQGKRTDGSVLYCPWYACTGCARAIIQCGIVQVIGHKQVFDKTPERWRQEIEEAFVMFADASVDVILYDGKIFDDDRIQLKFDGSFWTP